jgi:hypothetical protein
LDERAPRLTVYSRSWCHLCDDLLVGLRDLQARNDFELEVIDVETDPALEAAYGNRVPVVTAAGAELCHAHLDYAKVNEYLSNFR